MEHDAKEIRGSCLGEVASAEDTVLGLLPKQAASFQQAAGTNPRPAGVAGQCTGRLGGRRRALAGVCSPQMMT